MEYAEPVIPLKRFSNFVQSSIQCLVDISNTLMAKEAKAVEDPHAEHGDKFQTMYIASFYEAVTID